jgi:uncharacterized protein
MSGYRNLIDLNNIAVGLNIEGHRPTLTLPANCKWYNIVQVIDEPLKGINFDDVMKSVNDNKYEYIEQATGIDIDIFINQLVRVINKIKINHKNILVHVHQYTGTTILDKTLHTHTGLNVILDTTNFFETPINYSEVYPNIDCLISISQCAGFGHKAGTWIIPTNFMEFDVGNNIINTTKIYAENDIERFVDFEYVKGSILIVNDLWNPDLDKLPGVLLLDQNDMYVLEFVKENTKIFDESHNWQHAIKVAYNSTKILNNKFVLYLALLHDVCDHKYKNSIGRDELSKYIHEQLSEYKIIDEFIEKISFSKQIDHRREDPIIEAVRDGDRIEAIGYIGIERCIQFTESIGGKVPEDVIKHCFDKLLRLLPEGYIITKTGIIDAIKHHNILVTYVRENLYKTGLKYDIPDYWNYSN